MSARHGARVVVARWHFPVLVAAVVLALPASGHHVGAAPGSLDPSFGTGGRVVTEGPDAISALALQPDGRLVAVGPSTRANSDDIVDIAVVRYTRSGALDASFGVDGIVLTDLDDGRGTASDVAIQVDGRIVVAVTRYFASSNDRLHARLVRYHPDGTQDATFGDGGWVRVEPPMYATSVLVQPDGAIVLAGTSVYTSAPEWDNFTLVRFTADGTVDSTFGIDGVVSTDLGIPTRVERLADIALQDDGRIVALGSNGDFLLARYMPDGSLDPSFGVGGKAVVDVHNNTAWAYALAIQADGKIVAVGEAYLGPTLSDFYLVRLSTDGSLDPSFHGDGKAIMDFATGQDAAHAVAIDGVGRIILAGTAQMSTSPSVWNFGLARYNADGSLDTSFGSGGRMTTSFDMGFASANAVLLQPDGKIVAAGSSSRRFALARYDGGIPHASAFFLHGGEVPPEGGELAMRPAPPSAQPLTVDAPSVTWLSEPPLNGVFPAGATFRFVTPCTKTSGLGKTVHLASTDLDGANEQLLGTAQSAQACGRTETVVIPVPTPVTLTNRRLKLTVTSPTGVHLQLGPRTFISATAFQPQP